MEDAGFTFGQLDYIIRGHDDPRRPLAPVPKTILSLAKTLYDGLNAIDQAHPDITNKDDATDELIRGKAGLLYEQPVVDQIIGLLDGTTVYATNAPANQTITIPDSLAQKLKYSTQKDTVPPTAVIQVAGILTDAEIALAKSLSPSPDWGSAIDRVGKQPRHFLDDYLFGIFPNIDDAAKNLLAGDVNPPPDPNNSAATDANTAPAKRFYLLQHFLPFLRQQLSHRLVVETLAGAAGLANDVTDVLLSGILVAGPAKDYAIAVLENVHHQPPGPATGWKGYLIPPAAGSYTFIAISDTQPAPLVLNGTPVPFPHQQDDPSNVWSSDPVNLKSGTLYALETGVIPLQWKTAISPKARIPASALLPNYTTDGYSEAFVKLFKTALLVNGFNLSADEVAYLQSHPNDFDQLDFNAPTLQHWRRLQAYGALRDGIPKSDATLLDLFKWANGTGNPAEVSARIAALTLWNQDDVSRLIAPEHFDLNRPEAFRNEINLVRLQNALKVSGGIGAGIDRLFGWANPASKFAVWL